ncbi:MAG TPA: hypothetical protein VJ349_23630, partial [Stellaceae bacterium]|nr:hypothetical protein [Stellaceae bacterium]
SEALERQGAILDGRGIDRTSAYLRPPTAGDPCNKVPLHTGESIPQCEQALAAKPGCMKLLARCYRYLALIHCRRRLAAEGDSVIANDVDAHGWGLLIDLARLRR